MKRLIALLFSFALCFATMGLTTACGNNNDGNDVLKVGMECAYQPFNWTQLNNSNGAIEISGQPGQYAYGYDVMIAQKIADKLGKKLEIYAYEWDSLIPAVQSGALDFIIAGMSPTAERLEEIDFSSAYYESNLVIVTKKTSAIANATSLSDLAGYKISAQSATFHEDCLSQLTSSTTSSLESFDILKTALSSGTIDGYIAEEPGALADCAMNSNFTYIPLVNNQTGFAVTDLSNVTIAVGLKKGSDILDDVNEALASISTQERAQMMQTAISLAGQLS